MVRPIQPKPDLWAEGQELTYPTVWKDSWTGGVRYKNREQKWRKE